MQRLPPTPSPSTAPTSDVVSPIGHYLMAAHQLTPAQVTAAVRMAHRQAARIGVVLLAQGVVSPVALADALVSQSLDRRLAGLPARFLGERLLAQDAVTPDQLAAALYTQLIRRTSPPLGQLLVDQGVLDPALLARLLADDPVQRIGQAGPARIPTDRSPAPSPISLPATALVLEDDPVLATVITAMLSRLTSFTVRTFTRVAEVTAVIQSSPPSLFVIDRRLPDGDGLLLAAQIRVQVPSAAIVLLTADTSPALFSLMEAARIEHYIPKPLSMPVFAEVIRAALKDHALEY